MQRYKATIEYDGANYAGFQVQPNGLSIQEVLENALSELFHSPTKVVASGRTDAGVCARGQVIHFDSDTTIPAGKIPLAIIKLLPSDIAMLECEQVDSHFHARYGAKRKTYSYSICVSKVKRPLYPKCYIYPYSVDMAKLKQSASQLVGTHDFGSFMAAGSSIKTTVRTIYDIDIIKDGDLIKLNITGNGFLYNMVRIIVGTLLDINRGRLPEDTIAKMLETGDRKLGGHTAPSVGLCLESVIYQ